MSKKSSTFAPAKVRAVMCVAFWNGYNKQSMLITILKSKIHRVRVTEANLDYVGSITIDENLMDAAGIVAGE